MSIQRITPSQQTPSSSPTAQQSSANGGVAIIGNDEPPIISKVRKLLEAGQAEQAFNLLKPSTNDPVLKNARGVCLLRMGQPELAIRVFRALCLSSGGILLRADVPDTFKANFATAIMLNGNISGGVAILSEISDSNHPQVKALHAAVRTWVSQLSIWQRILWWLGGDPTRPIELGAAPGELQ